ncbi:putative Ubiquitin-conjugating enzyme E2 J1 [Blattamonas nauphoetae]|uniref:Ubiquitin-conjugating enzyme E2 J1 n=1 Tax=Blattamonas nauphoetae TaxID=2049346 RepID=A0ABQ9Y9P1_9EUKA|nr:putative Ubiquitin-conjugating enzyme E2 J1 [Blattamonas nauphoetae]
MPPQTKFNVRNPSVRRLMKEMSDLHKICGPDKEFCVAALDDNIFEVHFTIRGTSDTAFEAGLYHGKLIFPPDYPFKPPEIYFLNPNGRFALQTKICLSISSYHPEEWQASWDTRTMLIAIAAFFPTPSMGGIGGLDYSDAQRRDLAVASQKYKCPVCGIDHSKFLSNKEFREREKETLKAAEQNSTDKEQTTTPNVQSEQEKARKPTQTKPKTQTHQSSSPPSSTTSAAPKKPNPKRKKQQGIPIIALSLLSASAAIIAALWMHSHS